MAGRFKVETIFQGVDRISAPLGRIEQRVGRWSRSLSRRLRSVADVTDRWRRNLFRGLAAGGALLTGAVFLATRQLNSFSREADDLAKRSRRLEFPIEELQEWAFVAGQAGFESAEFDKAIEGLAKRMGEMRTGSGSLFSFLQRTDRQLLRTLANTTSMSDSLEIVIEALQRQTDPMMRAALASAAFGRQGLKFANISELGADAIERLRQEMRENGVITRGTAEDAEAYNDSVASLRRSLMGVRNDALAPLLPMLTEWAENAREIVIQNRELISQSVLDGLRSIVDNFDDILKRIKQIGFAIGIFIVATSSIRTLAAVVTVAGGAVRGLALAWIFLNAVIVRSPIGRTIAAIGGGIWVITNRVKELNARLQDLRNNLNFGGLSRFIFPEQDAVLNRLQGAESRGAAGRAFDRIFRRGGEEPETTTQDTGPSLIERITASRNEQVTTERAEVVIRDETGRAELQPGRGIERLRLQLQNSGDMR